MSAVSSFYGEFGLDIDKFVKAVRDIQRESKSIENSLKPLKIAAEDLGKTFAASGAAITGALGLMVHSAADYGEALNKASIQTGITTEKLSALKYMAEQEETTFETLSKGLKAMATQANTNGEAFATLGIKVTDSQGRLRPMDALVQDVATKMSRMEDGTRKNTLASEVFGGKLGQELIPTLNRLGREGLDPALKKVDELGLKLSKDAAMAADEFNDSITDIKAAMLGFSNTVATALIPGLTDTTHGLRDAIVAAKDFAKENELLVKAIALVGVGLTGTGGLLLGLAGIVSIYPKVVAALTAIKAGLAAMSAETIIATAGIAALIGIYLKLDSEAAAVTDKQKEKFEQQSKAVEKTIQDLKNLHAIKVEMEQGDDTWLEFEKRITIATKIHGIELGELAAKAKKAAEDEIKAKEFLIQQAKKNKDALIAFDKEISESAAMVAHINDGVFHAQVDAQTEAKKKQAETLKALDEKISDMQRALWQADTGVFKAQVEEQADIKKRQADELEALGKKISEYQKAVFGVQQNQIDAAAKDAKKKSDEIAASAERVKAAWANAIENLNTRLGESFAGMIVSAKFSFDSLVSIAKQTAQNMLSAFLSGVIRPLTSALAGLGSQLGGVIFGGVGAAGGIGTKSIIGQIGTSSAVAGTTGGISSASLLAFATNPITIGVAAAAAVGLAIKHFVGQGRRAANEFGESVQVPFGSALSGIIDPFDSLKAAGRLTLDQATKAYDSLTELWATFVSSANQFASQGKDQAKVVSQAFATMTQNFGPGLKNLFDKINGAIADLSKQADGSKASTASSLAGLPETGRALSASTIFATAVDVFKGAVERVVAGGGAAGPPVTVQLTVAPQFDIRVDSSDLAFQVRDVIIPEILNVLSLGANTATTRLIQILKQNWAGVVTTGGAAA